MRYFIKSAASKTRGMRKNRSRIQENAKIQKQTLKTKISNEENIDTNNTKAFDNIEVW